MKPPPARVTAAVVSDECRLAAKALSGLQKRLASRIINTTDDLLIREMQALDGVEQTLEDLATLFSALADTSAANGLWLTEDVTSKIKQKSLLQRLTGEMDHDVSGSIELF